MKKYCILLSIFLGLAQLLFAQNEGRFDAGLSVKNMHYWRGLRVSDALVTAPTIGYYNGGFSAFVWGGMSVDGKYREVSHIVSYQTHGFSITLLDIFNFSGQTDPEFFNYKKAETTHLIDLSVAYQFNEKFPLRILAATMLFGNDRLPDGNARYSTYIETGYRFTAANTKLEPFVSFGTALAAHAETGLYTGDKASGIVQVGLMLHRNVETKKVSFPVNLKLGYNPTLNETGIELSLGVF